jgi:prephenate dehydrogenase
VGGSWAKALREVRPDINITAADKQGTALKTGLETGAIDCAAANSIEAVHQAELVIVSTPVCTVPKVFAEIAPYLRPGCLVTDVGSTKQTICRAAEQILPPTVSFIGGHPMAGSEVSGIKGACSGLFRNSAYILVTSKTCEEQNLVQLEELITMVGARIVYMTAEAHDFAVAGISHLPHVVAATLANTALALECQQHDILDLAAGGFRDTTRIAASSAKLWLEICCSNKPQLLKAISLYQELLGEFTEALESDSIRDIYAFLHQAQEVRLNLDSQPKNYRRRA